MAPTIRKNKSRRSSRRGKQSSEQAVGKYFGDAWSLAKRTASGLNEIRRLINVEEKVLQTDNASASFDTTGTVYSLTTIAQGTDYDERIGNSIKLISLEINARIFMNTSSGQTVYRFIVFRDLDGYGTAPTTSDLLDGGIGTSTAPMSFVDFLRRKRFSILFDERGTLSPQGERGVYVSVHMEHDGHVLYLGTTAAAASNGKGSIYLAVLSDETTNAPTIAFQSRVIFTDD